jgi:protein required for attachment to host cells
MHTPRVLYLLADGAHARFIERSPETGYFVTVQEIDGRDKLRALRDEIQGDRPTWTTQQGLTGGDAISPQDYFRTAKEAFAAEVADHAASMVRKRAFQGVFLAAPARLIAILRKGLDGKAAIAGELNRDLTQTPDAELDRWLPARPMATVS